MLRIPFILGLCPGFPVDFYQGRNVILPLFQPYTEERLELHEVRTHDAPAHPEHAAVFFVELVLPNDCLSLAGVGYLHHLHCQELCPGLQGIEFPALEYVVVGVYVAFPKVLDALKAVPYDGDVMVDAAALPCGDDAFFLQGALGVVEPLETYSHLPAYVLVMHSFDPAPFVLVPRDVDQEVKFLACHARLYHALKHAAFDLLHPYPPFPFFSQGNWVPPSFFAQKSCMGTRPTQLCPKLS